MPSETQLIPVDAAGRRLALTCSGAGAPAVVLETGLIAESDEWATIQHAIEPFTRVCRYDRANRGRSDPAPKPRSAADAAADLHALLGAAQIPTPVIVVGHSLGGIIARLLAHRYPADVAGLVLVDPSHENQFERIAPLFPLAMPGDPGHMASYRDFWTSGWRDPARNAEGIDFLATRAAAQTIDSLGDTPMLVLSAGSQLKLAAPDNPHTARMQALWEEMHREMLRQTSQARQIMLTDSGHFVQRDQPEAIVAAIREMVESVRRRNTGGM